MQGWEIAMIESVEIKNYKAIDYLKVENLTNINFFVGKNNCGKTSLLEAIFLNFQPANSSEILVRVIFSAIRRIKLAIGNLDWLFHKMDINNDIEIKSIYDGKEMYLKIKPRFLEKSNFKIVKNDNITNEANINIQKEEILGLNFEVRFDNEKSVNFDLTISNNGNEIIGGIVANYPLYRGLFISSDSVGLNNALIITEIRTLKKEQELNKYLGIFDKNILSAEVINNEVMLDIKDMPKRISINTMGEGFKKYLLIIGACIVNKFQYICIDEIENGLHFESMEKLIKATIEFCKEVNIQLFISTHSYEFLKILSNIAIETRYENISVFNLANTKLKGLQAYYYNMAGVKNMIENKVEFRD